MDRGAAFLCLQETHLHSRHAAQLMFPYYHVVGSYRGVEEQGGGILTVVGEAWRVLQDACREFWVGIVVEHAACKVGVVNVYIPPTTSAYAPASYEAVLSEVHEWLVAVRMEVGGLTHGVVCGDFNARAGALVSELA